MISYAQNYEDVLLRRVFIQRRDGFYVDAGAADPVRNSVTHYFYGRGWSGINIEPEPESFARLIAARPRDVNLRIAVASEPGEASMVVVRQEAELSTLDPELAADYSRTLDTTRITVRTTSLEAVLREHARRPIDFVKIDVEGREGEAVASFDLERWAPTVLIVEATRPLSTELNHHEWEPAVTSAGYQLALFDGLNRYYAHASDERTLAALRVPANFLDNFIQYRWWKRFSADAKSELIAQGYPDPGSDTTRG